MRFVAAEPTFPMQTRSVYSFILKSWLEGCQGVTVHVAMHTGSRKFLGVSRTQVVEDREGIDRLTDFLCFMFVQPVLKNGNNFLYLQVAGIGVGEHLVEALHMTGLSEETLSQHLEICVERIGELRFLHDAYPDLPKVIVHEEHLLARHTECIVNAFPPGMAAIQLDAAFSSATRVEQLVKMVPRVHVVAGFLNASQRLHFSKAGADTLIVTNWPEVRGDLESETLQHEVVSK